MNKNNEYVNMEKYQEMIKAIEPRKLKGDFSWLKGSSKGYKKELEDEIKRLEKLKDREDFQ